MRAKQARPREREEGRWRWTERTRRMGRQPTGVSEAETGLNVPPVAGARVRGSERARKVTGGQARKDRGRNAGPLAPSSPWLQSLRGVRVGKRGIMGPPKVPQKCCPQQSTTTVQLSRRLVPSTPARVPRPRRLALLSGGPLFQVPQMPAAIFVPPCAWCVALCNPSSQSVQFRSPFPLRRHTGRKT